jgi:3-methyladenine DNA glycosylase AlkD
MMDKSLGELKINHILTQVRQDLIHSADEKTKENGPKFFKEDVKLYGVKTAIVTSISKKSFETIKEKDKGEILNLCEELWKSGYMEETFIACNWSYFIHKQYEDRDLEVFGNWLQRYVSNWAACDTLCNHTIGTYLEMYPHRVVEIKEWARSENRWMRRGSAVSLIIPARKGNFLDDILEIAGILLLDQDDLVQKGYGWMLKAASQAHQEQVFHFVMEHNGVMPRTALRYAIEKMPAELKKEAMVR